MPDYTKESTVLFFRQNSTRLIEIKHSASRLKLSGRPLEVYDLDLCSTVLSETQFIVENVNLDITLTFHDDFVGIHLISPHYDDAPQQISIPLEIPYSQLILKVYPA